MSLGNDTNAERLKLPETAQYEMRGWKQLDGLDCDVWCR